MRNRSLAIGLGMVLSFFLTTAALPAAELDLKPGEWEIQVKMQMPGMPFPMPPATVKQCLTPDEPAPNPKVENQECAVEDLEIVGNTFISSTPDERHTLKINDTPSAPILVANNAN